MSVNAIENAQQALDLDMQPSVEQVQHAIDTAIDIDLPGLAKLNKEVSSPSPLN